MTGLVPGVFFVHFRPTSFVAEIESRIVGVLIGFVSQTFVKRAYIHVVAVDPSSRNASIARNLYEHFFDVARAAGSTEVGAITQAINVGSIAFHERMGFRSEHDAPRVHFLRPL